MINFKENGIGPYINVAQSYLFKKENEPSYIKFKFKYTGTIEKNTEITYKDKNDNVILTGKIKQIKELGNDPITQTKIYEATAYDKSYILKEANLNKIYLAGLSLEEVLEDIVEKYGLTFVNELNPSGIILERRKAYFDRDPIEAVNELCSTLGAVWRQEGDNFILYRQAGETITIEIDGTDDWNTVGWIDDTSKMCERVIVKGAKILQRTSEQLSGTGTIFYTTRTPEDMEIEGLVQTTETFDGDYVVTKGDFEVGPDVKKGKIEFDTEQTDPLVYYSYYSLIRVEAGKSGDEVITKEIAKNYIESASEARKFAREYLKLYADGLQTSEWKTNNILNYNINNIISGKKIRVINKLNPNRDGEYLITKVERTYPKELKINVGEDIYSLYDWQKEAKDRIKQIYDVDSNADFAQVDISTSGDFDVKANLNYTHFFGVRDLGEILFASETTLASDGDLISDDGLDEDFAMAVDDDGLSSYPSSYVNYLS